MIGTKEERAKNKEDKRKARAEQERKEKVGVLGNRAWPMLMGNAGSVRCLSEAKGGFDQETID
jgi:hypothetical protein